jgi:hypothetical protein
MGESPGWEGGLAPAFDSMKLTNFSFRWEPMWMLALSLGPAMLGLLALFIVLVLKHGR